MSCFCSISIYCENYQANYLKDYGWYNVEYKYNYLQSYTTNNPAEIPYLSIKVVKDLFGEFNLDYFEPFRFILENMPQKDVVNYGIATIRYKYSSDIYSIRFSKRNNKLLISLENNKNEKKEFSYGYSYSNSDNTLSFDSIANNDIKDYLNLCYKDIDTKLQNVSNKESLKTNSDFFDIRLELDFSDDYIISVVDKYLKVIQQRFDIDYMSVQIFYGLVEGLIRSYK